MNNLSYISLKNIKTPCYLVDETLLLKNAQLLAKVSQQTGAKVLLALKAFAMYSLFPTLKPYLAGTTASSLHEARLGCEKFGGETHIFSAAYDENEFAEILKYVDCVSFNSFAQHQRFKPALAQAPKVRAGLRINPEHSEVEVDIYNPCARFSRLGITKAEFKPDLLDGISGLHIHNLCQKNADALERTLTVFIEKFGQYLPAMSWLNLGGGHHLTRPDYDLDLLARLIGNLQDKYNLVIYLEPGEAVALNAGFLVASVLDFVHNEKDIAILNTSAATHMPDVLEMPYRPEILGAKLPGELPYTYRLAGPSCLSGDIIGDYAFEQPLKIGQQLIFTDMAHYTMVKNNTFNGINLPSIGIIRQNGQIEFVKHFGYTDFKSRL